MAKRESPKPIPALDAHNDGIILREVRGEPMDFAPADPAYQADLPRMRQGGIQAAFVMVGDNDLAQSSRLIGGVYRMCADHAGDLALCRTAADVRRAFRSGRFAIVMSIESQTMFEERIEHLYNWRRLGVRVASLTHGEGKRGSRGRALQIDGSFFGYLTPDERRLMRRQSRGLTPFARESLGAMADLGIPCDLAHANDVAFWETLECAAGPVCYTHGACYAQCPHSRNLTDEMMRALAERGGVMGICFHRGFIDQQNPTVERLADHFLHALDVMGPDHVGIGSDFDGVGLHKEPVIPDAGRAGMLWEALAQRGVARPTLRKIAHGNFLRLLA